MSRWNIEREEESWSAKRFGLARISVRILNKSKNTIGPSNFQENQTSPARHSYQPHSSPNFAIRSLTFQVFIAKFKRQYLKNDHVRAVISKVRVTED